MRLFVAVLPPRAELDRLTAWSEHHLADVPHPEELRWTEPDGRHLTLAFLGEVGEELLPELGERLARAAGRQPPLTLRLSGGGRFGDRALWIGVTGDTDGMARLAASVAAAADRTGIEVDRDRPYHAHLTLARGRRGARLRPWAERLAGFEGHDWTAHEIALMRSHPPTPGTPGARYRYEALRTWRLEG